MADILLSPDMWHLILGGLQTTVVIFVFAALCSILLGSILTYLKITHRWPWIYKPVSWFVSTVHDIPAVALMMFFYYIIFSGKMHGVIVSIIALGVYSSGSMVKIFSLNIMNVNMGQIDAGLSLGMSLSQCYRHIVIPQAVKSMLPFFLGELKLLLRCTSYAGYIAQKDLIKSVDAIRSQHYDTFLPLIIVSLLYLLLSWLITISVNYLYKKKFKHD